MKKWSVISGQWSVVIAPIVLGMAVGLIAAADKPPVQQPADDVQELVFLGEARPFLVRLHVRVDGQPVLAAWNDFQKYIFAYLDINGDGVLDKAEVERVPSATQILAGGFAQGGFGGAGRPTPAPTMDTLDTDKDGKVAPAELAAFYRKNGLTPFQFQLEPPPNPFGPAASLFGGSKPEPSVSAVSEATFTLFDADKDGKLSKDELAAATAALLRLDEDEDEIVTTLESAPDAGGGALGTAIAGMMANPNRSGAGSSNKTLMPIATPGEAPTNLVKFMLERYGPKADKPEEKKLSRKDLGLDEATFKLLDANNDGVLDAKELADFVKRPPDLELTMRLGKKEATQLTVEVVNNKDKPSPLAGKVQLKDGLGLLDLGVTRVDLQSGEPAKAERFGGFIQQQVMAQIKPADANGDGVIDEAEAKKNPLIQGVFKKMDRDGDGKITEKELNGYLEQGRELQKRAEAACVALVLTDQSRGLFDRLDVNRDSRLSVREMRQSPKLLQDLDREGKGYLTKEDIPHSYRLLLRQGTADTNANPAALVELYFGGYRTEPEQSASAGPLWLRRMDRNRDGDVSRKEFLFSDEAFRRLDLDGDGLISVTEAEKAETPARPDKK